MSSDHSNGTTANILLGVAVMTHVAGVFYFRAQPPVGSPEGMSNLTAVAALFSWYSVVVLACLLSVYFRIKHIVRICGISKHLNALLAILTLFPVVIYSIVVFENLT